MPTQVQIPDGTLLEFPDGMSEADMRAAIYSNFPHLKPESPEGFESEDVVSSEVSRSEKRASLVKQMESERRKGMFAKSLENVVGAAEATAKAITSPIEFVKQTESGIEAAATLITGSPKELAVKPSDVLQRPLVEIPKKAAEFVGKDIATMINAIPGVTLPQATSEAIGTGFSEAVVDFANFMQTPEGVAMLGIGSLPETVRRGVTVAISAQMAAHSPESFKAALDAAKQGDVQAIAKHATEFLGGTALSAMVGRHSLEKPQQLKERLVVADAPLTAKAVEKEAPKAAPEPKVEPAATTPMKPLPDDWRITVKSNDVMPDGTVLPTGFVQIDAPETTAGKQSFTAATIGRAGYEAPDFSKLPDGKYTVAEAKKLLAAGQTPALPAVKAPPVPEAKPVAPAPEPPKVETKAEAQKPIIPETPVPAIEAPPKVKTPEPLAAKDVESMLAVDIPNVEEARARVKDANRSQATLRDKANALEREIKEIEKIIKPQRGSAYARSKIKATAPKAQVARYHELRREWNKLGEEIGAIEERVREDRRAVDAEADAKIIADPAQSLLRRLDRQARRLDPKVPAALRKALNAELTRVILEKYPDATADEIKRLAPEVRRSVYFQSDPWKAMDAPKLESIRSAALDAAVNAPDIAEHMLSDELKAELDQYRKAGRTYGGPISPDAPVEPLSAAKLVELKERIRSDVDAWRKRDAEQKAKEAAEEEARKAEDARLIAEAQKIVATAKRVGTVGGRSAKEVKEELIERIEEKMEALVNESGVTLKKPDGDAIEYVAASESGTAFGDVSRSGEKYRVAIRTPGGDAVSRTVDSLEKAEMLIKAMASIGKGHVIIAVPGDGIFRIRNNGPALIKVWDNARRLSTGSGAGPGITRSGGPEKPPVKIKTESDWNAAKEYHGLTALDEIAGWSPALAEVAKKVNPDAPEKVTTYQVDEFIKKKSRPEPEEHARSAKTDDPFERARKGDDKAFDDLDAQFREIWPDPEELAARPGSAQVFTPEAFRKLFDTAFGARDFDRILTAIKATSDVSVWKPYLKELFAAQSKDPVAAKKAEWFRHVFNGTRPADAIPPKPPKPPPPPPPTPPGTGKAGPGPKPPPTPPATPPPRIAVEPITGGGAKSPYKIIQDFENALGKAIRVRRMRSGALGQYAPSSTQASRRFASDLDTTAHELAGHWVDDKYGVGKPWVTPKTASPYDSELAKFWIHGSVTPRSTLRYRRAEGIAEYIRAYIVNPAQAMKEAPNFTAYFEKTIPPKALQAIRQFSNDLRTWAGEDPLTRAGLNIRMDPPTLRERLWNAIRGRGFGFEINPLDRLRLWFDDPYHYAVKAWKEAGEMRGGLPVKPEQNFEILARLLSGHDARMMDQFDNGLVQLKPKQVKTAKGKMDVERAIDPVTGESMSMPWLLKAFDQSSMDAFQKDMRDASAYMVAERTIEKSKQLGKETVSGIGAGIFTDVQAAKAALKRAAEQPELEKRLKEAARRYRLWADHNIQMLVDAGRLSKEQAKDIRDRNEYYVDMHRLSEEFDAYDRQVRGVKIGTTKDVMKRFRGSALELDNVYSNLLEQTDSIQKEAHRNVTMRAYTDMIEQVRSLHGPDLKEYEIFGAKAKAEDRNTIRVWKDGKAIYWKFAPEIFESLKGLGDLGTHAFIDFVALPAKLSRYIITHSPQFMARNPVRDSINRAVNSRNASTPWDILKGYTKEDLSRFNVFGGGQFGNYIVDRHVWNREIKRVSQELVKDPTNILLSPLKLKRAWERLAEASETVGRVAEFRRAFDKAKNEFGWDDYNAGLYAASEARGLMDFAKAGTVMRVINRFIPFSNAAVRGLMRDIETIKTNPKGFAVRWGTYVLTPTILTMLWNMKDDETWEEYTQQPGYLRDFFWSFKVGDYWLRIPKPHTIGVLASGVERAVSRIMGEKHSIDGYGRDLAQAVAPVGDPVDLTGPLKSILEVQFNRDTFRNRDIVPAWERELKLELRKGKEQASAAGETLANVFNAAGMELDPRQMDHILQSYGGIGQLIVSSTSDRERPLADTTIKGTGYFVEPPAANARDVQWVIDWAKKNGHMQVAPIRDLIAMRKEVLDTKDIEERNRKGKKLRKYASTLREQIEKNQR